MTFLKKLLQPVEDKLAEAYLAQHYAREQLLAQSDLHGSDCQCVTCSMAKAEFIQKDDAFHHLSNKYEKRRCKN